MDTKPVMCESESGFGFESGFKKKGVDSDSAGFRFEVPGFGSGFEMAGFAHHCTKPTSYSLYVIKKANLHKIISKCNK